ncbi:hypothetical protein [Candidatus Methylospira mobilis]|uniref:hypothetical protein n=1 Tax=Candidatus Methylospira mobilis TaxID=1808979 RepID=UPI00387EE11C
MEKHRLDCNDADLIIATPYRLDIETGRNGERGQQAFAYVFDRLTVLTVVYLPGKTPHIISFRPGQSKAKRSPIFCSCRRLGCPGRFRKKWRHAAASADTRQYPATPLRHSASSTPVPFCPNLIRSEEKAIKEAEGAIYSSNKTAAFSCDRPLSRAKARSYSEIQR